MENLTEYGPWEAWQKGDVAPSGKVQVFKSCGTINTDDALNIKWIDVVAFRVKKIPKLLYAEYIQKDHGPSTGLSHAIYRATSGNQPARIEVWVTE